MAKIVFIYLVVALALPQIHGLSEELQELIDNLHKTCTDESGAKDEQIVNARNGNFADDDNFKCYFKCIYEQMGCLTDDGNVDQEAVIALMPPELADKATPVIRACNPVGANSCDTAWLTNKCYQEKDPKNYFLP